MNHIYTLEQIEHLRNVRLKAFDENAMMDDNYTNDFYQFSKNTDLLLNWIKKMEANNKIDDLLATMPSK